MQLFVVKIKRKENKKFFILCHHKFYQLSSEQEQM